ncbi:hypothetical protein EFM42_07340 [Levilactobacillus brevis]|uniref:hypothetical protein n=1 Tax=Levilactobacillus brevis TaxID=1580 RepID=UPI0021A302CD|nr:hypothetical protein [Levilactobacillus brevis]MCT2887227.1 hypothetical protein [Levilactobacillus brevis]
MIDMRVKQYHITSESRNVIVSIAKLNGDGTPNVRKTKNGVVLNETVMGYYPSLTGAFIGIADRMTRVGDDKVTTISEYESQARSIEMTLGITAYKYGQQVQDKLEG